MAALKSEAENKQVECRVSCFTRWQISYQRPIGSRQKGLGTNRSGSRWQITRAQHLSSFKLLHYDLATPPSRGSLFFYLLKFGKTLWLLASSENGESDTVPVPGTVLTWSGSFCFLPLGMLILGTLPLGTQLSSCKKSSACGEAVCKHSSQ